MTPEEALAGARQITAALLDSDCVDDPEELLLPFAEAFRALDEAGAIRL
jgi:hypothetical protein